MEFSIESIADHVDVAAVVARWRWNEWGSFAESGDSPEAWSESIAAQKSDCIPTTYLAFVGSELVGAASLVHGGMTIRTDLAPWLSGVYIRDEFRGHGIASALTLHVESKAAALGVRTLYLYTNTAESLYARLGWGVQERVPYRGSEQAIMAKTIGTPRGGD